MLPGRLVVQRLLALPPLAWSACITGASVRLFCGDWVDADEQTGRWFEGAWAAPPETDPLQSHACFATGGRIGSDGVTVFGPSHTSERLWLAGPPACSGGVFASNSLPMLLADAELRLDWRYRLYVYDLHTIMQGPGGARTTIPVLTRDGAPARVQCALAHGWRVDPAGAVHPVTFPASPEFGSFRAYRAVLSAAMHALAHNATHASRRRPMRMVATLSGGYDSPATAVLAHEAGCRDAALFTEGRDTRYARLDDDGRAIARRLGFNTHVAHRLDYLRRSDLSEACCLALGEMQDTPFAAFEQVFSGRLVITGHRGGVAWATIPRAAPRLANTDYSGCTLTELRLRFGFVPIHLAFVGLTHLDQLRRISRSDDMAPWRIGGEYDRPIARRIVEEAGVPRGEFATLKAAVSQGYRTLIGDLRSSMTPGGWASLEAFAARQPRPGWAARLRWKLADGLDKRRLRALRRRAELGESLPFNATNALLSRPWLYTRCHAETALHWANDLLRTRYEGALRTVGRPVTNP